MKLFKFFALLSILSIALVSCDKTEENVKQVGTDFLNAYFETDFEKAINLSTGEMQQEIKASQENFKIASSKIQESIKNIAKNIKVEATNINKTNETNYVVSYKITRKESTTENFITLTLINGEWKVNGLNSKNQKIETNR